MNKTEGLDLRQLPPIFILPSHLSTDELHELEDTVYQHGGSLSYEAKEARIFLGLITQKKRATFELRSRGVWTEEAFLTDEEPPAKRRKVSKESAKATSGSDTESGDEVMDSTSGHEGKATALSMLSAPGDKLVILKVDWLQKSVQQNKILPIQPFLVLSGRIVAAPANPSSPRPISTAKVTYIKATPGTEPSATAKEVKREPGASITSILERAKADAPTSTPFRSRRFYKPGGSHSNFSRQSNLDSLFVNAHPPKLYRATTSEFEQEGRASDLPPLPPWALEKHPRPMYASLRSTPAKPINAPFLSQLYAIKEARLLTLDEIGVRAYSTSIASLSAYPHKITSPLEITRLPGCSDKIASLWIEWYESAEEESGRHLQVVQDLEANTDIQHLRLFWNIWGVGADTARKFYFEHGWQDLDDVVEFGWTSSLNRVQQIGVKFYDEFQQKIPRAEVESIADVILRHARLCRDIPEQHWSNAANAHRGNWAKPDNGHGDPAWDPRDMVVVIVGGYRRGKRESGDVDVIVSHRDPAVTKDLVVDIVRSLESEGWVTHTLTLNTTSSDRDQQTLPFRARGHAGHGFDSLDKALCVWQDPRYDETQHSTNPNIHRRVDIIISPWRTVGCAVLGWSGATTFQRDIRRWVKRTHGWKFDSSGIRDRGTGVVYDFENPRKDTDGDGWEDRERRVMDGIGIGWRPGVERCTG